MNRFLKTAIGSVAVGATMLASLPAANAGDHWRYRHNHRHYHGGHGGDALAAGIVGLAAGALIVGLANQPPAYRVYDRDPAYAPRPHPDRDYPIYSDRVVYSGSLEPWSAPWYQYCADRYQSFNPHTGTFTGYDGEKHFCVAN